MDKMICPIVSVIQRFHCIFQEAREAIRTSLSLWYVDSGVEGQRSECVGGGERDKEMPSYFSRVNCAKILMELELHDVWNLHVSALWQHMFMKEDNLSKILCPLFRGSTLLI